VREWIVGLRLFAMAGVAAAKCMILVPYPACRLSRPPCAAGVAWPAVVIAQLRADARAMAVAGKVSGSVAIAAECGAATLGGPLSD